MKVVKQKKVDDCYESSNTVDFMLNAPITKSFVEHLGKLGKLILFEDFDIPYFKVIVKGEFTIKGAFGKKTIRILLPEDIENYPLDKLVHHIENFTRE